MKKEQHELCGCCGKGISALLQLEQLVKRLEEEKSREKQMPPKEHVAVLPNGSE